MCSPIYHRAHFKDGANCPFAAPARETARFKYLRKEGPIYTQLRCGQAFWTSLTRLLQRLSQLISVARQFPHLCRNLDALFDEINRELAAKAKHADITGQVT
jgi:hypothetical protein